MKISWMFLGFAVSSCIGAVIAAETALERSEEQGYSSWYKVYRRFPQHPLGSPPAADDPEVSFDIARMYRESDLVIDCTLGNYLTETDHLKLVVQSRLRTASRIAQ